jgi:hypothetical protein
MAISTNSDTEAYTLCWLVVNNVRHSKGLPINKFARMLTKENKHYEEVIRLQEGDNV